MKSSDIKSPEASRRAMIGGSLGLVATAMGSSTARAAAAAPVPASPRKSMPGKEAFLWGTATSGHQIEGNNINADFWLLENVKPTIFREPSGDACDSYNRFGEDIELAARLGFNAHRFGIEWARIEPEPGIFSEAELDHYVRVLEKCHEHGLAPMVTFSHWTVPRWFAARGGFESSDSPQLFERYAEKVTAKLGPLMAAATTFNECNIARVVRLLFSLDLPRARAAVSAMLASAAHASGSDRYPNVLFADIAKSEANQLAAHHRAVKVMKEGPGDFPVGLTISMTAVEGVGAVNKAEEVLSALYGPWIEAAKPCDFVGVQTYTRLRVGPDGPLPVEAGAEKTDAGYEYYPQALGSTIRYAAAHLRKPIYVTENGIAAHDDSRRVAYIDGALASMREAQADGIDVRGYFHWSLLDNFEWTAGYSQQFGLIEVDRKTFARTPKPSAAHLGRIAQKERKA